LGMRTFFFIDIVFFHNQNVEIDFELSCSHCLVRLTLQYTIVWPLYAPLCIKIVCNHILEGIFFALTLHIFRVLHRFWFWTTTFSKENIGENFIFNLVEVYFWNLRNNSKFRFKTVKVGGHKLDLTFFEISQMHIIFYPLEILWPTT
jgi:hypothetical protein